MLASAASRARIRRDPRKQTDNRPRLGETLLQRRASSSEHGESGPGLARISRRPDRPRDRDGVHGRSKIPAALGARAGDLAYGDEGAGFLADLEVV
jgi:hypothetical protein